MVKTAEEWNGPWEEYDEKNGQVWKGSIKNGYREGLWKAYHENGQLACTIPLAKGRVCGEIKSYDKDGQLTDTETDAIGWGWSWPTKKPKYDPHLTYQEVMALRGRSPSRSKTSNPED